MTGGYALGAGTLARTLARPLSRRERRLWLVILLAMQAIFFWAFLPRPLTVVSDNVRYETAGYNLAAGRGLSLPYSMARDPEVRSWVCDRRPDLCLADGTYPVAIYPPGYSVFISAIYRLTGRSLVALAVAQFVLLGVVFVVFEALADRLLAPAGYRFAMLAAITYPFLARQATLVMSDHLHAVLLLAALAALLLMAPGWLRGAVFGLALAAATLVRPYSLLAVAIVYVTPRIWRCFRATAREWAVSLLLCALPFAVWSARNWYLFGRWIPLSTTGVGLTLYFTVLEWEVGDIYDPQRAAEWWRRVERFGPDATVHETNLRLQAEALRAMAKAPGRVLEGCLLHAPKLWVSLGTQGAGRARTWPVLVLWLGGLWVLGLAGMWLTRCECRWLPLTVVILGYWLILIPFPGEARRTLPLRLPMLLVGAAAFQAAAARLAARAGEPTPAPASVDERSTVERVVRP